MNSIIKLFKSNAFILVVLTAAIYSNTLFNGFVWDDVPLVEKNPVVQQNAVKALFSIDYWKSIPQEERGRLRPLRTLTFVADHILYGGRAWGYHLTNMLLQALNVYLVYMLAVSLFGGGPAAFFAALIFAVHPVHVESIAWVKNRSDVICSIFILLSMLAMLRLEGIKKMFAVAVCFIGAVLSKETAVIIPFALMLLARVYLPEEKRKENYKWLAGLFLIAAAVFLAKELLWRREITAGTNLMMDAYIQMRIFLYTLTTYFNLLLLPVGLSAERDVNLDVSAFKAIGPGLGVMAVAGAALFAMIKLDKKGKLSQSAQKLLKDGGFGYALMIMALIPVANIVFLETRPIAEQRLYIPSIGYSLMFGAVCAAIIENAKGLALRIRGFVLNPRVVLYGLLAVFAVMSFSRNFAWRDDFSFWKETVRTNPAHYRANYNLALIYINKNDIPAATKHLQVAALDSDIPEVFFHLARCYDASGEYGRSIDTYRKLLNLSPNLSADVYNNLAVVYDKSGDSASSAEFFKEALKIEPNNQPARLNLAQLYQKQGKKDLAGKEYKAYIKFNSGDKSCEIALAKLRELGN